VLIISISTTPLLFRFLQLLATTPFPPVRLQLEWSCLEQVEVVDLAEKMHLQLLCDAVVAAVLVEVTFPQLFQ
jgi:hypothetical protein